MLRKEYVEDTSGLREKDKVGVRNLGSMDGSQVGREN